MLSSEITPELNEHCEKTEVDYNIYKAMVSVFKSIRLTSNEDTKKELEEVLKLLTKILRLEV